MDRLALTYGLTGQVVEFYPPEAAEGVPSAASCSVWRSSQSNDDTAELTPTPTIDSVSLSVNGASGHFNHAVSRRRIVLAATTGLATRRKYLVQNATSQREVFKCVAISSSGTIYADAEHDLVHDYPLGSSVLGIRLYFTIDPTFIATESKLNDPDQPYRLRWRYTIASIPREHWTYFDVVRVAKKHGVTVESFLGEWPSLWYQLDEEDKRLSAEGLIASGWEQCETDLRLAGVDPNSLRDSGLLDVLVKESTLEVLGRRGEAPPGRDVEQFGREAAARYRRDFEKAVAGNRLTRSEGTEGNITTDPVRVGWFTS